MAITQSDITAIDTEIKNATVALDNIVRRAEMIAADEHSPKAGQVALHARLAMKWVGETHSMLNKLTTEVV